MGKICYKLDAFEGPLDLLLYLISKNKLDILDINIFELIGQYSAHIDAMRGQNMEIASEFLEMASRLVYIKSVSLLPKHEEAEELKRELSGQLLEYQECKRIAGILGSKVSFDSYTRIPQKIESDPAYCRRLSPVAIMSAYGSAVGHGSRFKPPSPEDFSAIVTHKVVSVKSKIISVLKKLRKTGRSAYVSLFSDSSGRSELIATFLAVLELIKGRRIRLEGEKGSEVVLMNGGDRN